MLVLAGFGLDPWDVLHQGLSRTFGLPIGTWAIIVSFSVLLCWLPLRQRPGVGTLANATTVGLVIDLVLSSFHAPHAMWARIALLAGGGDRQRHRHRSLHRGRPRARPARWA